MFGHSNLRQSYIHYQQPLGPHDWEEQSSLSEPNNRPRIRQATLLSMHTVSSVLTFSDVRVAKIANTLRKVHS